jgi:16S rRNA C967 or C1407 C5-methylase (RsmB/RsmF family)
MLKVYSTCSVSVEENEQGVLFSIRRILVSLTIGSRSIRLEEKGRRVLLGVPHARRASDNLEYLKY